MEKLYEKITDHILQKVKSGELKAEEKVPSENELAAAFGVSRMTARKAVDNLVSRGYLYKVHGKGTYVSNQKEKIKIYFDEMTGFHERAVSYNKTAYTVVIRFEKKDPSEWVRQKLNLSEGEVYYIERLRFIDGRPVVFEISYMPVHIFPELTQEKVEVSKYDYLKELGHEILWSEKEFFAVMPDASIQQQLHINDRTPVFKVELTGALETNELFEYTKIFYNQTEFRFLERVGKD
ncbi:GntR family transcriptional regulator [Alteribacillus sp. JSM 102045]|uniref:GntR family transcriptional regulator n=1 Tax=Alteribacillus sp. JSM 102045 TaxID=1562101 RepID=UPI0035C02B67